MRVPVTTAKMRQSSDSVKRRFLIVESLSDFYIYQSMEKAALKNRRIADLVEQDYVRAYVLHYFGISFYDYSEQTLAEVCEHRGLKVDQVVQELESSSHPLAEEKLPLVSYPLDLIIEYLKHAHFLFVKHKLPYISKLVESFKTESPAFVSIAKDLKTLFPLFVEDFIHHIYHEEDTLFRYIQFLDKTEKGKCNPSRLFYMMERHSLERFAVDHEVHDDEMEGIRRITSDYAADQTTPLHVRVIYAELTGLEKSLQVHARIENEILFPKAMLLENKIRKMFVERIRLN
jgi:regulator of cell morphogenesis and NO signaling